MAKTGTELAKAYVQIIPSADGIKGSITQALGGEADSAGQSLGGKIAARVKTAIAAAGIGAALGKALSEGAALEQSLGGINTLFGEEAAAKVIANARAAYETAGMSANQYMETVTSFSASLIKSLGDDTQAAALAADQALVDMADNANKMGTSMESIQNAYQGFAKQNYTMLDNLKLGYGGTQSEMQRLLKEAQKISGVRYDIGNLADVYAAIHVIQEDLGITGATADEAAKTLSGSFAAMKAAATNVLGSLTLGEDVKPALQALAQTMTTFLVGNLLPALGNIISALPGALYTFVTAAVPQLVAAAPQLVAAALEMLDGLAEGLETSVPALVSQALPMLEQFTANLRENAGMLVDAGLNLIANLANGLIAAIPDLIAHIPQIIINICGIINDNMPKILGTGVGLIANLIAGIVQAVPDLIANFPKILEAIASVFSAFNWMAVGKNLITMLGNGIKALANAPVELAKNIGKSVYETFKNGFSWSSLGQNIISGIASGIRGAISGLVNAAIEAARAALSAVKNFFGIASPSKLMRDEVGKWLPAGIAVGIEANTKPAADAMRTLGSTTTAALQSELTRSTIPAAPVAAGTDQRFDRLLALMQALLEAVAAGNDAIVRALAEELRITLNGREFGRLAREAVA